MDDGEFVDKGEPHFSVRYVAECAGSAFNLDLYKMGRYSFCFDCEVRKECIEFAEERVPLLVLPGYKTG